MEKVNTMSANQVARVFVLATSLAIVGCNGGNTQLTGIDRGGSPAYSATIGEITGFGSIYVNGTRYEIDNASVSIDGDAGTEDDLALGQIVTIIVSDTDGASAVDSVASRNLLEGRVTSIDATGSSLSILDQTVRVGATTIIDGFADNSLGGISVSDRVDISGYLSSNGDYVATRISFDNRIGSNEELSGTISALDETAMAFQIGNLRIDYSSASQLPSQSLSNGLFVEIEIAGMPNPGNAIAQSIEIESNLPEGNFESIELEGIITRFSSTTDFDINGVPVSTSATTSYSNGDSSSLGLNVRLEAKGATSTGGVLLAEEIEFRVSESAGLQSQVQSIDVSTSILSVFGVNVEVVASTRFKDEGPLELRNFSLDDINVADYVEIIGEENGSNVVASLIKRKQDEQKTVVKGQAGNIQNPSFELLGQSIVTNAGTNFEDERTGLRITAAEFFAQADGLAVQAEGQISADTLIAESVEIDD